MVVTERERNGSSVFKHRLLGPCWKQGIRVSVALLVVGLVVMVFFSRAPAAHATGTGHYQTNQGRWHTSIDLSYTVDSGIVTWSVKGRCWIDDYPQGTSPFGTSYYATCSLFHRTSGGQWQLDDWQVAQGHHLEPYHNPAAIWYFATEYSATNVTWAVEITSGYIAVDWGNNYSTKVDQPPNYVETDATT